VTVLEEQKRAPLFVRVLGVAVMVALVGALLVWGIDLGRRIVAAGSGETDPAAQATLALQDQLGKVSAERDRLDAAGAAAATALKQAQGTIEALRAENGQLAGDLLMEDEQLPEEKAGTGLRLLGLRAAMVSATRLQYGLLLAYGGKKARPVFNGQLQLTLAVVKDGKHLAIEFPAAKNTDGAEYVVNVQHHQRVDGVLELPDGASAESLQVRLLDKGQVVAHQSINVKEGSHVRP
jgi:hypothetical protein